MIVLICAEFYQLRSLQAVKIEIGLKPLQCNNSSWCYLCMLLSMPQACWGLNRKLFSNLQFYKIIPNWG